MRRELGLLFVCILLCAGQELNLKRFEGKQFEELMRDREVIGLPLTVQVVAASSLFSKFAAMPGPDKYQLMEKVEEARAGANGRRPITFELWSEKHQLATKLYVKGREYKIFRYGSFILGVALVPDDRELVFHISGDLRPDSNVSINFVGDQAELVEIVPRIVKLPRLSGDAMAKRATKGRLWRSMRTSLALALANETETSSQSGSFSGESWDQRTNRIAYSGTYQGRATTTRPDVELQREIRNRAQAKENAKDEEARWYVENEFLSTTLRPGQAANGLLYFDRDKKSRLVILRVLVGAVSLEFPFDVAAN